MTSRRQKRVLLACYGGGHVQSLLPVARRLAQRSDIALTLLPFTTARRPVLQAGLPAQSYTSLLAVVDQAKADALLSRAGVRVDGAGNHAAIPAGETLAYHAVGLHDLSLVHGEERALELFAQQGRALFCPTSSFTAWLPQQQPDLVITSSSPRSELALQRAARSLGIPGLVVSDLFLQREAQYICDGAYARQITVINDYVASMLRSQGLAADSTVHVTGNPAFDAVLEPQQQAAGDQLRTRLGLSAQSCLVSYYAPPAAVSLLGEAFVPLPEVVEAFEQLAARFDQLHYLIRLHPNDARPAPQLGSRGFLSPADLSLEACLWASDAVVVENSTVGFQAGLIGVPVFKLGNPHYPPYVECGIARYLQRLDDLAGPLSEQPLQPRSHRRGAAQQAPATEAVLHVIDQLLS